MDEINIKEFFRYFRRYIVVLVVFLVVVLAGVFVYDKMIKKPVYQAQTSVIIAKSAADDNASGTVNDINASLKLVPIYNEIVKSEAALSLAIEKSDVEISVSELRKNISTKAGTDTAMLTITVSNSNADTAALLANRIVETSVAEMTKAYQVGGITQLSKATAPTSPSNNTLTRDLIIAAVVVVFGVVGLAFLRFYFDKTVRYGEGLEKKIDTSVAGCIPETSARGKKDGGELVVETSPMGAVSESIKSLRTNLQFATASKRFKTLLVTSANNGEGKSFVASNLAASFAQTGKKVLLVDCNLRRGSLHKVFNISNDKGLSDYLGSSSRDFEKYAYTTKIKNLSVMPCGSYPSNPSELLASKKNKDLVKAVSDAYEVVIFDGASVLGLADSVIMASYADETLIVVKNASTTEDDLAETKEALNKVGAKIAGVAMNMTTGRE